MDRRALWFSSAGAGILVLLAGCATNNTIRISVDSSGVEGNRWSEASSLSGEGRYVAFESGATNLAPPDTNRVDDILVRDNSTGRVTRVSVDNSGNQANDASYFPFISADGRFVAFASSATNLVPGDTHHTGQVYVRDLGSGRNIVRQRG